MTTPPDHDELRIRGDLRHRIDGTPQARPRDWLDDYLDATTPPTPPTPPKRTAMDTPPGEPRWDWRRLLHWPYARPCCGATAVLVPWYRGQSAALAWGHALSDCRAQAAVGAAYVLAGAGLAAAAVLVHRRRTWWAYGLLTCAFVGTVAMAHPYDLVQFATGAVN